MRDRPVFAVCHRMNFGKGGCDQQGQNGGVCNMSA